MTGLIDSCSLGCDFATVQASSSKGFCTSAACLKFRGHLISIGGPSGSADPLSFILVAAKSLYFTIPYVMLYTEKRKDLLEASEEIFSNIAKGVLRVRVNHKYPLSQVGQAHFDLENRKTAGSIVLIPDA
ncbi:hypothetical protein L1887_23142 [Cichorium endivia]|nr:hypothetical protein L1887_23142 [Cichorium endivia]